MQLNAEYLHGMAATFGQVLRELRRATGVTQRILAEKAGVDVSYISKLENDRLPAPAADTILRFSEALAVQPDALLSPAGKVPPSVTQLLGTQPAALRFFRQAADLAVTDGEWEQLRRSLAAIRGGLPGVDADSSELPQFLRPAFWDYALEDLSWPADRDLVISRILSAGDWPAVSWLRKRLGDGPLRVWLTSRRGRGRDAKRLRFWELVLELPHRDVEAWLADARRDAWTQRTAP